jgi:enoyl-CoA hydratase
MNSPILTERAGSVGIITLNRPEVLNAWDKPMRDRLVGAFEAMETDAGVRAVIITGAGPRAFSAGQDFNEGKTFNADRAEQWMGEWERLYDRMRSLSKPIVAALNGVAAGSAFQVALLCDIRVGHPGVRMGQPEINTGIASVTGPWIMRELIGLARTIDLTLTGRMMDAEECHRIGLINRLVPQDSVMQETMAIAELLASKPQTAMRLDRQRLREMTEPGFRDCLAAGVRIQRESFASGEPTRMMNEFLALRACRDK